MILLLSKARNGLSGWNKRRKLKRSLRASLAASEKLASFGQYSSSICVETSVGPFLVDPADQKIGRNLLHLGKLNQLEIDLLKKLSRLPHPTLLVVGAHIGTLALPVAKHFERVIVVEANPKTARLLERNIALQQHQNVRLIQAAASDTPGELEFLLNRVNSGGSKRLPKVATESYLFDAEQQKVSAVRLDDVVDELVDVILLDIEGGEIFALQGMRRLLSQATYLSVEFLPHLIRNVASVGVDEWLHCIPLEFDSAHCPDQDLTVFGRGQILEFLRYKFESFSNVDQLVFFCADRNPAGLG